MRMELSSNSVDRAHYSFDLRDVAKVTQGLMMAPAATFANRVQTIRLFVHEALRVFHDGLISPPERQLCFRLISDAVILKIYINPYIAALSKKILFGFPTPSRPCAHLAQVRHHFHETISPSELVLHSRISSLPYPRPGVLK